MASYHIRKYREPDHEQIVGLYSKSILEHAPTTFHHLLKLPRTLVLLLGGPLSVLLLSGSWPLTVLAFLLLLTALKYFAKKPWSQYIVMSLNTDMSDISKYYFSERGSCFWVAESEGQVVGMVGALPVKEPALRRVHLELLHMCVDLGHRGQGIAKALVKTVLQFGQDEGYRAIVLSTTSMQHSALALYQGLGFQKTGELYYSLIWRLAEITFINFIYQFPAAQVSQGPK
ncbi:putative N-acetyltransferase 8B [Suncus etruscus]|uniref:putative N-acetyltransferase 8B n=1 Tax=Suncus etruscus TaxID=109475 RepID=UPI002110678C|nr:putative N-acetyltransferase 8B [Suncus etruscus]